MATSDDGGSALVLVCDLSLGLWARGGAGAGGGSASAASSAKRRKSGELMPRSGLDLSSFAQHLHAFINAYLLVSGGNRVGLLAASGSGKSHAIPLRGLGWRCLYSNENGSGSGGEAAAGGVLEELKAGIREVYRKDYLEGRGGGESGDDGNGDGKRGAAVALSSAYSRALCALKRHQEVMAEQSGAGGEEEDDEYGGGDGGVGAASQSGAEGAMVAARTKKAQRILFLHGSKDVPSQYIQVMNASFCAQKINVVVDTFMLGGFDSGFLQQAANITGGIYTNFFRDRDMAAAQAPFSLSTYLVNVFLAHPETRKDLQLPRGHATTNLKVSCFLTKKALDVGFVCSVCLSIFSRKMQCCAVCGTAFQDARAMKKKVINRQS